MVIRGLLALPLLAIACVARVSDMAETGDTDAPPRDYSDPEDVLAVCEAYCANAPECGHDYGALISESGEYAERVVDCTQQRETSCLTEPCWETLMQYQDCIGRLTCEEWSTASARLHDQDYAHGVACEAEYKAWMSDHEWCLFNRDLELCPPPSG